MQSVYEQYKKLLKGGVIGSGDKLNRDTWKSWFITVDYWAIIKNVKQIYKKSPKSELRRKKVDDNEKKLINVTIIIKISEYLNTKNK